MSRTQRVVLLVALAAVVLIPRVYLALSGVPQTDDAYITYRYAQHLADGEGFVYNPGERVLGTTSPLYTFLLACAALLGLPLPGFSLMFGFLCSALAGVTLFFFAKRLRLGSFAFLAPVLFAFWPTALNGDLSGLETPLFTLLVTLFFFLVHSARYSQSALCASLATLTRPEGLALVAALFVFLFLIKRKRFAVELTIVGAVTLPWLAFSWNYFGSPIPNTITAKLALYLGFDNGSLWERLSYLHNLDSALGWLALLGVGAGLAYLLVWTYWGFLESLFALALTLAYALSDTHLFFWYKAPLSPLYALFLTAAAAGAFRMSVALFKRPGLSRALGWLVVVSAIPVFSAQVEHILQTQLSQGEYLANNHIRAGKFLSEHQQLRGFPNVVVAEDIGYLGYFYRGRIIDRDGLISPEVIKFNLKLDYAGALSYALKEYPAHWLFLAPGGPMTDSIRASDILDLRYRPVSGFASGDPRDYLLYQAVPVDTKSAASR